MGSLKVESKSRTSRSYTKKCLLYKIYSAGSRNCFVQVPNAPSFVPEE